MAQTPRAGTDDSQLGQFHRSSYRWLTLFNYDSNLPMCSTFFIKLLLPTDYRGLVSNPKETYDLNLSVILSICSLRIPTAIFGTKNCTILVGFHPLGCTWQSHLNVWPSVIFVNKMCLLKKLKQSRACDRGHRFENVTFCDRHTS